MTVKNARKIALAIAFVMAAIPFVFANGTKDSGGKSASKAKISVIHFMSPALDDGNSKAFAATMAAYRKAHPAVTVSDEFIQHDNYEMKLKTMVASKELPDVYYAKPDLFGVLRENDLIMPIDDILKSDPDFAKLYKKGAFSDFIQNGKTWALPFQLQSNQVVYYNKEIFRKAGYEKFPTTMDDFVKACAAIRKAGFIPIAVGNKGKWLVPSCFYNTLVYRYTDAKWFDSIYNKKGAKFTDKPFVDAATLMTSLVKVGAFNDDMNSIDNNQQRTLFYSGEAAMFIEGSWALGPVIENVSADMKKNVGLAVLPPVAGKESLANLVAGGAGWGICINNKISAEQKKIVIAYVKEVYGQTFSNESAKAGGFPPMVPQIDPSSLDSLQVAYNNIPFEFGPIFDVQLPSTIVDVFYNDMQKLLMGKLTPMEYAQNIEAVR